MKSIRFHILFAFLFVRASAQTTDVPYISTQSAAQEFAAAIKGGDFVIFPEVREQPIQWPDSLKPTWLKNDYSMQPFRLHAQPGEYFVFQVGVWAAAQDIKNARLRFSDLINERKEIVPADSMNCFNSGGTNFRGMPFKKQINIPLAQVQALWMGIDLPKSAKGSYAGTITVLANGISRTLKIQLEVSGEAIRNHGFDEGKRLSRMQWLNSTVAINERVTKRYSAVRREGNLIRILGRSMEIGDDGFPKRITSYFTPSNQSISARGEPVTDAPFRFVVEKADGTTIRLQPGKMQFTSHSPSFVTWKIVNTSDACDVICSGRMEYDGFVDYQVTVKAKELLAVKDIRLEVSMPKNKATYMMGLNRPGGLCADHWDWKWDSTRNQDALWVGGVNGGLRLKWKAENYSAPLVNVYYTFGKIHLPPSWDNQGKGGVRVSHVRDAVVINAYSGGRTMRKDEEQQYNFELLITPFKTIDKSVQFGARYYQSDKNTSDGFIHAADSLGANIINVHQGNDIYPFINYPYSDVNVDALKDAVSDGHRDHKRVKVYYTTRELTVNLPELWAMLSLDGEVIYPGPGAVAKTVTNPAGPDPWLKKNLRGRKYIPAWVAHFTAGRYAGQQDLSVITTPDSRLNNFYVAGLDWMISHLRIDGIYVDDCSMDRTTIRRARKLLDDNRSDANIDMHSWNHFNGYAGWASCLNLYMDLFPYLDQLWIGEDRNYNTAPDYWLVEISGIPFGLPSQMLQDGGNPWKGMIYGMTNRAGWTGTPPDHIWSFWDRYNIKDKIMIGYWDTGSPVTADDDSVKVTVYKGKSESIVAVANFSNTDRVCTLHVDGKKLGYGDSTYDLIAPKVERYQEEMKFNSADRIAIPAGKGYLFILKEKR